MVIEQYTIATPPRYNFPQFTMDAMLPQCFTEQSLASLRNTHTKHFHLNQQDKNIREQSQSYQSDLQPIPLEPDHKETTIAACDTSTIKIGETNKGMLIAVRGATVWKQNVNYRYTRFGPFVFHITEDNKREVYNSLEKSYFKTQFESNHKSMNLWQMPMRIAGLLERWLQTLIAKTANNGVLLFDGSLTAGIGDTPIHRMKTILNNASRRENVVLAFSKMTNLRVNGHLITDVSLEHRPPCLFELANLKPKPPVVFLGNIYVARLSLSNYAFRLDINKEDPIEHRIEAVKKLLGNDKISQSYPETLRLAHILCTFTANEVLAIQHFSVRKFRLKLVNRPDMHRLLFGPFGRGEAFS